MPETSSPAHEPALATAPVTRAGLRLLVLLVGLVGALAVVLPLSVAVSGDEGRVLDVDRSATAAADDLVSGRDWLVTLLQVVTTFGDPLLVTLASALLAGWLWRRGSRRLALFVVAARLGAVVISSSLKALVDRVRPLFETPVDTAFGSSFPSGHSLGAAAFWTSTALVVLSLLAPRLRRTTIAVALVVPLCVAASRVLLGVHYLSDVVAGLALGFGWTAVCAAVFVVWRREEGRGEVHPLTEGLDPEAAEPEVTTRNAP